MALPDPSSYTQLPWQPNVAVMQCDPTVEGELWPYAPRVILRRALESLARRNLVLKAGFEAEYSLVVRGDDDRIRVADDRDIDPRPCYDARGLTRMLPPSDRGVQASQHHGLVQLRQRPRRRQRPVRTELEVLGCHDHRRSPDPVPVDGPHSGPAGRAVRHVHAQTLRRQDRKRAPRPHEPVDRGQRRAPLPLAERPTARDSGSATSPTSSQPGS